LGERLLCKQEVIGSIPFTSTISGGDVSFPDSRSGIGLCHCEEVFSLVRNFRRDPRMENPEQRGSVKLKAVPCV
jgi:hypothetical protein